MKRIAIVGCGTMGEAIVGGLRAMPDAPRVTHVTTRRQAVAERLRRGVASVASSKHAFCAVTEGGAAVAWGSAECGGDPVWGAVVVVA